MYSSRYLVSVPMRTRLSLRLDERNIHMDDTHLQYTLTLGTIMAMYIRSPALLVPIITPSQ